MVCQFYLSLQRTNFWFVGFCYGLFCFFCIYFCPNFKDFFPSTNPGVLNFFLLNLRTYGHLILDKGGKNIQWIKDNLFNKWWWENWPTTYKRMKLENFLTSCTKINSKWIKDQNVKPETIKLIEVNTGRTLSDTNHSKILYDLPPWIMEIKTKIKNWT